VNDRGDSSPEEAIHRAEEKGNFHPLDTQTLTLLGLDFQEGQIISNKYRLMGVVGRGGMGVVYKAEDIILKRCVALKFLRPEFLVDTEAKSRFLLEAQVCASIDHPYICPVYEINEEHRRTYIVMPFVEGQNLRDTIKSGACSFEDRLSLSTQIAEGLAEAHKKGIIHRDIKTANIMVTQKHQARIMDFGLAKLLKGSDITITAKIMGTISYMSPEQARGDRIDARTDVWSLGVVLFELFAGRLPFVKKQSHALLHAIIYESPPLLRQIKPELPEALGAVVDKCLQKEPDDRYIDAGELAADLKSVTAQLGLAHETAVPARTRKAAAAKKLWLKIGLPAAALAAAFLLFGPLGRRAPGKGKVPEAAKAAPAVEAAANPGPGLWTIEEVFDDRTFSLGVKGGLAPGRGETGLILAKPEFDRDRKRRSIGQFFVKEAQADRLKAEIVDQVETVKKGDYLERAAEPRGTVLIQTEPKESEIYVNGILKGRTEVRFLAAPMKYRILVKKKDFKDKVDDIDLKAGDIAERKYNLMALAPPPPELGNLFIDTNPQEADVFVDEKKTPEGKAPLRVSLSPGPHRIKASLMDYADKVTEIKIQGGQNKEIQVLLERAEVLVRIDTLPPAADVMFGDPPRLEGKTPFDKAFPTGHHKIKIKKEGFFDIDEEADLSVGTPYKKSWELKAVPPTPKCALIVNSIPDGARIFVDNVEKGATPFKHEFTGSQVQIRVLKEGYKQETEIVHFKAGEVWKNYSLAKLGKGRVSLSAEPQARVVIDGEALPDKVPPLRTVEVTEGLREIKFLFDDNVEIVRKEYVPPNETVRVHCNKAENKDAITQRSEYQITAFPKATIQMDGVASGSTIPPKTIRVREGPHQVSLVLQEKDDILIGIGIQDTIRDLQKKRVHVSLERASLPEKASGGAPPAGAEAKDEDVAAVIASRPVGVQLDGKPVGEVLANREWTAAIAPRDSYRWEFLPRLPGEDNRIVLSIRQKRLNRVLKIVLTMEIIK
jgi:tRNA A-37 threonylcarbamoyl transferase component Bud32